MAMVFTVPVFMLSMVMPMWPGELSVGLSVFNQLCVVCGGSVEFLVWYNKAPEGSRQTVL
jgi:hypothetical protein